MKPAKVLGLYEAVYRIAMLSMMLPMPMGLRAYVFTVGVGMVALTFFGGLFESK